MNEQEYERGFSAAMQLILARCMPHLQPQARDLAALVLERSQAVEMLRQVCAERGDNDWPADLHLSDVIEKHLWRHLGDD